MNAEKIGQLNVEKNKVFSLLNKSLYSQEDIVFREIVSNSADAINKRFDLDDINKKGLIELVIDKDKSTVTVKDNGIGMTFDEVDKFINQIAFSGSKEYNDALQASNKERSIIGHFGVGFYSSFMIAKNVSIDTLSGKEHEKAVSWFCSNDMNYKQKSSTKKDIGTDVTLYLTNDSKYLNDENLVKNILSKYFKLLAIPLYLTVIEDSEIKSKELINSKEAFWKKIDFMSYDELNEYYKESFNDVFDPYLSMKFQSLDLGIRGIIFFRKTRNETSELDGTFKIYNNGVFIGENIKQIIPKHINLQSGIIECSNLPLVVSRAEFRDESEENEIFSLIREAISQEIVIFLNDLFTNHREKYEACWEDLNAFVKYSILVDKTFASVLTRKVLFKNIEDKYLTLNEFMDSKETNVSKQIYYTSDPYEQSYYFEIFRKCGLDLLQFDHVIDKPFMQRLNLLFPKIEFTRIDSASVNIFKGEVEDRDETQASKIKTVIEKKLGSKIKHFELEITRLSHKDIHLIILNDENSRRFSDMMEIYGLMNPDEKEKILAQSKAKLLVNLNSPIIEYLGKSDNLAKIDFITNYLFNLALMGQNALDIGQTGNFVSQSELLLVNYIND